MQHRAVVGKLYTSLSRCFPFLSPAEVQTYLANCQGVKITDFSYLTEVDDLQRSTVSSRAPSLQLPRTRLHQHECNELKKRLPTQQTDEDPVSAIGNRNLEGVFSSPQAPDHLLASESAQSKHF